MSVPFSSDEFLLKRSLFSSIFGVANRLKQAKTTAATAQLPAETAGQQQQQHTFDESRQPCSSNRIFGLSFKDQQTEFDCLTTTVYDESSSSLASAAVATTQKTPACSPTTQLGQQFSDQLQFVEGAAPQINDDDDDDSEQYRQKEQQQQKQQHNNDNNNNNNSDESNNKALKTLSREQIYAEIVRECKELEKQQHKSNNNNNSEKDHRREEEKEEEERQQMMMMEMLMRTEKSELSTKTFSCNDQQQLITAKGTSFSLDLERLIKVVVAHVLKEMKNNSQISLAEAMISTKQKQRSKSLKLAECESVTSHGENAEQILERKREQNNAAAARYRQRQKEQKDLLVKELYQLEERNGQLKADIAHAQREIDQVKAELWRRWHN
ncbi:hypothetical protein niasHT_024449 [Heterodera trifolii]|uniref:BZIP domain-containing protein n=1 Tax=Heterodera trifolii TaxID=157864 RepID=A0ABD2JYG7_9BILA